MVETRIPVGSTQAVLGQQSSQSLNQQTEFKTVVSSFSTVFVSSTLECYSSKHLVLLVPTALIVILNFVVKIIQYFVLTLVPTPFLTGSRLNYFTLLGDSFGIIFLVFQGLMFNLGSNNKIFVRFCFYSMIGYLILSLVISLNIRSYYCSSIETMKNLKLITLIILVVLWIFCFDFQDYLPPSENSVYVIISLIFVIAFRIMNNFSEYELSKLFSKIQDKQKGLPQNTLRFYFAIVSYIDDLLSNNLKKGIMTTCNDLPVCVHSLMKQHRKNCSKVDCFCRINIELSPMGALNLQSGNSQLVQLLFLLDAILLGRRQGKVKGSSSLEDCHFFYKSLYLGRSQSLHKIIQRKNQNSKRFVQKLRYSFLKQCLSSTSKRCMKNSKVYLYYYPWLDNSDPKIRNKSSLIGPLKFLRNIETLKKKMVLTMNERTKYVEKLIKDQSLVNALNISYKFDSLKHETMSLFSQLMGMSNKFYAQLFLLKAKFLEFVVQDSRKGLKLYIEYLERLSKSNLNKVFFTSQMEGLNFGLIEMYINEEGQQLVKYATKNFEDLIGIKASKLEGESLKRILPQPYNSMHDILVKRGVGNKFGSKNFLPAFVLHKNKYVVPVTLSLKYSYDIRYGLSFIGGLQFSSKGTRLVPIILISNDQKIVELSSETAPYFKIGSKIEDLNSLFSKEIKDIQSVLDRRLKGENESFNISEISENTQLGRKYAIFEKWSSGTPITLTQKSGKQCNYFVKVKHYLIHHLNTYIIWMEAFDLKRSQQFRHLLSRHDFERIESFYDVMNHPQRKKNRNNSASIITSGRTGSDRKFLRKSREQSVGSFTKTPRSIAPQENQALVPGNRRPANGGAGMFEVKEHSKISVQSSQKQMNSNFSSSKADDLGFEKERLDEDNNQRELNNNIAVFKQKLQNNTGSVSSRPGMLKLRKIEMVLNSQFKPNKFQFESSLLAIGTLIIVLTQFTLTAIANQRSLRAARDYKNQVTTLQYFPWVTYSTLGKQIWLDTCRMAYEGVLDEDYFADWTTSSEKTTTDFCTKYLASSYLQFGFFSISQSIKKMINFERFDYHGWIRKKVNISKVNPSDLSNNVVSWQSVPSTMVSGVKFLEEAQRGMKLRAYPNDPNIQSIRTSDGKLDPSKDYFEHELRLNFYGDFSKKFIYWSRKVDLYVRKLSSKIKRNWFFTILLLALNPLLFQVVFLVVMIRSFFRVNAFYDGLLRIEMGALLQSSIKIGHDLSHLKNICDNEDERAGKRRPTGRQLETKRVLKTSKMLKNGKKGGKTFLKYKRSGYGFIFYSGISTVLILCCVFGQGVFYIYNIPQQSTTFRALEGYLAVTNLYNQGYVLHAAFFSTVYWNNTQVFFGKEASQAFLEQVGYMRNTVIDDLEYYSNSDFGQNDQKVKNILKNKNSCEEIFQEYFAKCPEAYEGVLKSGLLNAIRGQVNLLESLWLEWESKKDDPVQVQELIRSKSFKSVLASFTDIYLGIFNFGVGQVTKVLDEEVVRYGEIVLGIQETIYISYAIWIALFLLVGALPLQIQIVKINLSVYPLPFSLIENNPRMKTWLKEVDKRITVY